MEDLIPYQHPLVRDLAWALSSPPLLRRHDAGMRWLDRHWFARISEACREHLARLDRNPGPLVEAVARQTDRRLGNYFETLWRFWLEDHPRFQLLHANLVVQEQRRTLGEFDLLVLDRETGKTLHWELAVKFYLGQGDTAAPGNWWGPARRDRLDIKTQRLLEHQGRLSQHPAARHVLRQLGLRVDETWLIVKGRLFYPAGRYAPAPAGADPQHLRGFWVRQRDLPRLETSGWLTLARRQWLAPLIRSTESLAEPAQTADLAAHQAWRQPVCIARIEDDAEVERGFIVPDDWGRPASHGCE